MTRGFVFLFVLRTLTLKTESQTVYEIFSDVGAPFALNDTCYAAGVPLTHGRAMQFWHLYLIKPVGAVG